LSSLKEILARASELRIEDRVLSICNITVHDSPFTIAQSRLLAVVAPIVAKNVFKKKFYNSLLIALVSELTANEIDDETRINEVLITFSLLMSNVPNHEIVSANEVITEFHDKCRQKNRLELYVSFISYYCLNSKNNYEDFANEYLRNVLVLMNH
jgi:hypothetical protein